MIYEYFKPDLKLPSQEFLVKLFDMTPSYKSSEIKGFKSKTGKTVDGYFVMCPIVPDMLKINPDRVFEKVIQACQIAESLGVGIVVLGGFTSIAGEMYGRNLMSQVNVPITTGNTLTVAMVLDGVENACRVMDVDLNSARVTIIGGSGDIGSACARILSEKVSELTITGRNEKNLIELERVLSYYGKAKIHTRLDNNEAIKNADVVIAAASVSSSIIDMNNFKPGAVICDVGYPKNISYSDCSRDDLLIFSGGIASIPSEFSLGFDIGMPSNHVLYGCWAEAILLALEDRYENFSWGKGNISRERISLIKQMAQKHGFAVAPFFWGNRLLTEHDIERIRDNAKARAFKNSLKNELA